MFLHLLGAAVFAAGIAWGGARLVTWQEPQAAPTGDTSAEAGTRAAHRGTEAR